ncbi:suppressor of fused domain protein [Amycolatopsis sp. NPDC021455]|uniref:suppressor of fused domain protein n=1 Tax=Amycolatopsis sp. NPDC021455 TaxID=3154901 RepID=UPI0033F14AE2
MGLIEHLEARLGLITGGWSKDEEGRPREFRVAAFAEGVIPGARSFSTIGLSRHDLVSPRSGRKLRLELVAGERGGPGAEYLPGLVGQVADELLASHRALLRGDVVGPRGPLVPGSRMEAWYAAAPVYYDDGFAGVDLDDGNRAAIVWLVPISRREAEFVSANGRREFENELIKHDPDLLNLHRLELPLTGR